MRRTRVIAPHQRPLPFVRHHLWQHLPGEARGQCTQLCEEVLRAIVLHEDRTKREEGRDDREDPRRAS